MDSNKFKIKFDHSRRFTLKVQLESLKNQLTIWLSNSSFLFLRFPLFFFYHNQKKKKERKKDD